MQLSERANAFLRKSNRDIISLSEDEIRSFFIVNEAPIFEPLVKFQYNYGGYVFNAGLEPIKFSLLKGLGGWPKKNRTCTIEFEQSEEEYPKFYFDCASTNYQMQFFLDENGIYYKDFEPKASNFEKLIEHLALWDEIGKNDELEVIFRDKKLKSEAIENLINVSLLPEASDQFTKWYTNGSMYVQKTDGKTTIIATKQHPQKTELLLL